MSLEIIIALLITTVVIDFFLVGAPSTGFISIFVTTGYLISKFESISWPWFVLALLFCGLIASACYLVSFGVLGRMFQGQAHEVDAAGKSGVYRIINDQCFVEWNGDLWEVSSENEGLRDKENVVILSLDKGKATVEKMHN